MNWANFLLSTIDALKIDTKKPRKANYNEAEVDVLVNEVGTSYKILYGKFIKWKRKESVREK